jgi:sugar phosphate permease
MAQEWIPAGEGAMGSDKRLARTDPVPPSRVRYQVLFAACSVAVISYIHRIGFATASTALKDDFCLSTRDIGYLMTAFLLAYGGFEVPGGLLGDRFGVRHVLTILVLGWSLLTGCIALVLLLPAVWMLRFVVLWVLRFGFGMFQAGGFPSLSRMMTDWMPMRERASAQGLVWMSSRMGGALVPLLLGALFDWFGTWPTPLWLVAGLGVLWSVVFWPWFRNRPEQMEQVNDAERDLIIAGRGARPAGHGHLPWTVLFRSPSVWGLCGMYGFASFGATFFITMLPDYLQNHRGLTPHQTQWLTSLPLACGIVGCVAGGYLSDWFIRRGSRKWGRRLNGSVGLVCAGLALLATIWVHDWRLLAVLLCVTFFCNDLNMGPAWAACADIGERYAGTLGGTMNMTGNLSAALMASVTGLLLDRKDAPLAWMGCPLVGQDLLFVLFGCCFALASLCWLLVDVTRPLAPSASAER